MATRKPTRPPGRPNAQADPSGKLQLRMPRTLHSQLKVDAERQGVSLNSLIVSLLAGGIGFTLDGSK